jgi:AAA domain
LETATPDDILTRHMAETQKLGQRGLTGHAIADIPPIRECTNCVVEYLRDPELPRGAVIALTGDSGSGKSTLASAWAGEVAAAGSPVLVLDRENPISVVAERLERLGITDGGLLRYWGGWLAEPSPQPNDPAVLDWVKGCAPKPLVIVDSMVAFHGGDENDAGQMRAFMQQCRTLADLGAAVLLIHHDGKAQTAKDYRGSSDFKAAVDVAFHVSNSGPDGQLGLLRLRCYKSRLGFADTLVYHYRAGHFVRDQDPTAASRNVTEQLTDLLRGNPGIKATEFESLAVKRDIGRNKAREYLRTGVLTRKIRREGQGSAKHHYLVPQSEPDAK